MSAAEQLQTVFTADLTDLEKGLDKATAGVNKFGKDAAKGASAAGSGIQAGAGVAAAGVAKLAAAVGAYASIGFAEKLATDAAALGKMATTAGLTAAEFQRFTQGAQLSGFLGDSGAALADFAKGAGLARAKMGDLYEALKFMAPELAQQLAATKTTEQALNVYAEAIRRVNGEEAKATLARKAFGEEGAQLVPILRDGAAGLAAMGAKADEFTTKIDDGAIKSAKDFKVELGLLATEGQNQLTNMLAPAADVVAEAFKRLRLAMKAGGGELAGLQLSGLAGDFDAVQAAVDRTNARLLQLSKLMIEQPDSFFVMDWNSEATKLRGNLDGLLTQLEKVRKQRDAVAGNLGDWQTSVTPGEAPKAKDGFDLRQKPDYRGADAIAQAQQALAAARGDMFRSIELETAQQIEGARRVNEELILSEAQFQRVKSDLTQAGTAKRKQLEEDQLVALRGLQAQAVQASIGDNAQYGAGLAARTKAAELEYQNDLVNWQRLYAAKLITAEQFENARANVAAINNAKIRAATRQNTAEIESAMSSALNNGLTNALNGSKDAGKTFFLELTNGLARAIVQMMILKPLMDSLFSGKSGSVSGIISSALGSIGGGGPIAANAEGGGIQAGVPTFINERDSRKREVFIPQTSGRIVPGERFDGGGSSGGVVNNFTIDARGADAGAVQRIERAIATMEANRTNPVEASRAHAKRFPLRAA
jgi:hypothetical protein